MENLIFGTSLSRYQFKSFENYVIEFEDPLLLKKASENYSLIFTPISRNVGILNFKNFIGTCDFMGLSIRVTSSKITEKEYYEMLDEVVEKMAQLPFDFNKPTFEKFEIKNINSQHILYHTFLILRKIILGSEENLAKSFESILKNPSSLELRKNEEIEVWNARHFSPVTIKSILNKPVDLIKINSNNMMARTSLSKAIHRKSGEYYFPYKINEVNYQKSFDTPENRFVKHFLALCIKIIHRFKSSISKKDLVINRLELLSQAIEMEKTIEMILNHQFFEDVGDMYILPFNSVVLQKRDGYKEILNFYNMLNSSIHIPLSEKQVELIIENKDIAELYEIWTFIKMISVMEECYSIKPIKAFTTGRNEFKVFINPGIQVIYEYKGKKINLYYNRTFQKGSGSYSLTLRPDIVMEIDHKKFIFDAKFKIQRVKWEQELKDEQNEKDSYTFKNGDIYKMHTYKDAIKGAVFGCILYPHPSLDTIKPVFFPEEPGSEFGVGAISMLPGMDSAHLKEFLKVYCVKI